MAWEHRDKIAILVPHTGNISTEWSEFFFNRLVKPRGTIILFGRGTPWDVCRESLVNEALEKGATRIFFLDSDVVPNRNDVILYLMSVQDSFNVDVVSGIYWTKQPNPVLAAWVRTDAGYVPISPNQPSNYVEVDVVGTGCCLIKSDVFYKIPKPWFFWWQKREYLIPVKYEDLIAISKGNKQLLKKYKEFYEYSLKGSEDFYFFEKLKFYGGKIIVCMDLKCSHIGGYKMSGEGFITTPSI